MDSRESSIGPVGREQTPDPQQGQRVLYLVENINDPENVKELKTLMGTRAYDHLLNLLKHVHQAYQNTTAEMNELQNTIEASRKECRTLKTNIVVLQKRLTDLQQITRNSEPPNPSTGNSETTKSKLKIPDPPIFLNDGNPTWENWYTDMKIKLGTDTNQNEMEKMGYVLSRTGGNPRALIQTKFNSSEYTTAEAIIKDLEENYNDPNERMKARTLYRNLRMNDNERLENFLSKFIAYAARAGVTDDATKRDDLLDKVTPALREGIRPCLDMVPTFTTLRKKLGLIFWDIEAEKKRPSKANQTPSNKPSSSSTSSRNASRPSSSSNNTAAKENKGKEKPTYSDKRKAELSAKGACFKCEQTGHMAKDCLEQNVIKSIEANEDSEKEDP